MDSAQVPLYVIRCGKCEVVDHQDVVYISGVEG